MAAAGIKVRRRAHATWDGGLDDGSGSATLQSGAAGPLDMTFGSRTQDGRPGSSPEELIAAAHAACFSMALSGVLAGAGATDVHLETEAACTLEEVEGGLAITTVALKVRGRLQGLDESGFRQAADEAKVGCPVSKALQGAVAITVDAALRS